MKDFFSNLKIKLIDENANKKILGITVYTILGVVALIMTIMNIATSKGSLTLVTGVFALLCLINILLSTLCGDEGVSIASTMLALEMLMMFSYFLISGSPEGFSSIWICMLPSFGLLFFGRRKGSVICAVMFLILVLLLWVPAGRAFLQYDYTDSFCMRFPVLFVAYFCVGLFLESLRLFTFEELTRMQDMYKDLSKRDHLSGLLNRQGMYSALAERPEFAEAKKLGAVLFDIDHFKQLNDTYGHAAGDRVIQEFARAISRILPALSCRWGGEEFVAIYTDGSVTHEMLMQIKSQRLIINGQEINCTVSVGVAETDDCDLERINKLIDEADAAMYEAKQAGRNRIVYHT